ncbi:hypothetical protein [Propionispora hippei]|uniref:Uncharacterized protein n=1 Tax=Propionispora hippei DSM 15287 TaxID=1123003 RepID=A0A1M6GZG7_9FIRM|nr:hypothetical protein [Propionispora hippei]SHJ15341.1 hypothetical protein SAMN02745170_01833 [Propionispora hippei DSM 15287]
MLYFQLTHTSDILTIIFGLTSGILTLIGLVAIFIGMNNQQKLQKCRDLLWGLMALPFTKDLDCEELARQVQSHFNMYCDIVDEKTSFTKYVTLLSRFGLLYVGIIWLIGIIFLINTWTFHEIILILLSIVPACFILCSFFYFFGRINNLVEIGDIPQPAQILDTKFHKTGVNILYLTGATLNLTLEEGFHDNKIHMYASMPLSFHNFTVSPFLIALNPKTFEQERLICEEIVSYDEENLKLITKDKLFHRNMFLYCFEVVQFEISEIVRNNPGLTAVDIQLDLNNYFTNIKVNYRASLNEILNISVYNPLFLTPLHYSALRANM